MKKNYLISVLALCAMLFVACDDFLDTETVWVAVARVILVLRV